MASEVTMERKDRVLWPGLEVMYITSAHGSEPNHMGPTRLQEPPEYVVVLCAQEEEMGS